MGKQIAVLLVGIALITLASANHLTTDGCPAEFTIQHPWLFAGFCMQQFINPVFNFCPAMINIPVNGMTPDYCGYANDQWANYTFVCEAYNDGQQAFYFGPCSCIFMQCPTGFYCDGATACPTPPAKTSPADPTRCAPMPNASTSPPSA